MDKMHQENQYLQSTVLQNKVVEQERDKMKKELQRYAQVAKATFDSFNQQMAIFEQENAVKLTGYSQKIVYLQSMLKLYETSKGKSTGTLLQTSQKLVTENTALKQQILEQQSQINLHIQTIKSVEELKKLLNDQNE